MKFDQQAADYTNSLVQEIESLKARIIHMQAHYEFDKIQGEPIYGHLSREDMIAGLNRARKALNRRVEVEDSIMDHLKRGIWPSNKMLVEWKNKLGGNNETT